MQSVLEQELAELGLKIEERALYLGFVVKCQVVQMNQGWIPFKLRVEGASRRSNMKPEFADEKQEALITARQAKMMCRAYSLWAFWGKATA